jgi:hypothetical protein
MDVYVCVYSVCVVLCVGSGPATGLSLVKEVLAGFLQGLGAIVKSNRKMEAELFSFTSVPPTRLSSVIMKTPHEGPPCLNLESNKMTRKVSQKY